MSARGAVAGLGMTAFDKIFGRSAEDFADEAVVPCRDAGLPMSAVDGLLVNAGAMRGVNLRLSKRLGLGDLRLAADVRQMQKFPCRSRVPITNPARGGVVRDRGSLPREAWAEVARGGREDVDAAVEAAHRALTDSEWSRMTPTARGHVLHRVADGIAANADGLARRRTTCPNGRTQVW